MKKQQHQSGTRKVTLWLQGTLAIVGEFPTIVAARILIAVKPAPDGRLRTTVVFGSTPANREWCGLTRTCPPLDGGEQNAHVQYGLGHVVVKAGSEVLLAITNHGMGRQRNHRQVV